MDINTNDASRFGDLTNLSTEKLQELEAVLATILALPAARETYAQIIDGTPIRSPRFGPVKASTLQGLETIVSGRTEPSDLALQQYDSIRIAFSAPQQLRIDSKARVAQNYQNAPLSTHEHEMRLLEITAASVHALAGIIYASFHPHTDINPKATGQIYRFTFTDDFYVKFYHTEYQKFPSYPFGLLNVVGYWAEYEIFGGVILFERGESGSDIMNAFSHPQRKDRAFQISKQQVEFFASLGMANGSAKSPGAMTAIPFVEEPNARTEPTYVTDEETPLRIYKTEYDKPPVSPWLKRSRCVVMRGDKNDPRSAQMGKAMKEVPRLLKEFEQDQQRRRQAALTQSESSSEDASVPAKDSSLSPEKDPPSSNKKDV